MAGREPAGPTDNCQKVSVGQDTQTPKTPGKFALGTATAKRLPAGQPELALDERFATLTERRCHADDLDKLIGAWSSALESSVAGGIIAVSEPALYVWAPHEFDATP